MNTWRRLVTLLGRDPIDLDSTTGRSHDRYRRIVLTAVASAAGRGLGLLTTLVSVPLTVNYLGPERYGMWVAMSATVAIISFSDLGISNGLLNAVAEANGQDDRMAARRHVASAFGMLSFIAVVLGAAFVAGYRYIPWARLFNVSSPLAMAEAGSAAVMLLVLFLIGLPLGAIPQVRLAYQQGFVNAAWQGLGSLLALAGLALAITMGAGLPWLILALAGGPVLALALNGWHLFFSTAPWLRPATRDFSRTAALQTLKVGGLFLVLQLAATIGYQSDALVISQMLGAERVTDYAVPMRLFALVPIVLGMFLQPLWPAYREAFARQDVAWVRRTLRRSLIGSVIISAPLVIVLVAFGDVIIHGWVGPAITPSRWLLIGLGLWALLTCLSGPLAMFLNGANVVGFQAMMSVLMAVTNLLISITLVRPLGVAGPVFGTVIAQTLCILLPSALYVPKFLQKIENSLLRSRVG